MSKTLLDHMERPFLFKRKKECIPMIAAEVRLVLCRRKPDSSKQMSAKKKMYLIR
jgi:hypothetical protein